MAIFEVKSRYVVAGGWLGLASLAAYGTWNLVGAAGEASGPPGWVHGLALLVVLCAGGLLAIATTGRARFMRAAQSDYLPLVRTLASAIDAGDPFSRGRAYRVSQFCVRTGRHLGLAGADLVDLELAALLHDLGRTAIHHRVLLKPGDLSVNEREVVRTHPQIARDVLGDIPVLTGAVAIIHAHHEQPDGQGYPRGLSGNQIPLASRIIQVVAAFDSMTTERPYRPAMQPADALEELRSCSGTQFFPEVVAAFERLYLSGELFEGLVAGALRTYSSSGNVSLAVEDFLAGICLTSADEAAAEMLDLPERPGPGEEDAGAA
jgi:hypothetical protein